MIQKKFIYYICCLDPKIEFKEKDYDTLYSDIEFTEKQLKKLGIRYFKEIPSSYDEPSFASGIKMKNVLSYKKLGDLIFDISDSILTDLLLEDDGEEFEDEIDSTEYNAKLFARIFDKISSDIMVVKQTKDEDKFKIVDTDILFNCYKQTLEERGEELFDFGQYDAKINEDNECITLFYKTIQHAMTKFESALLIFGDGDTWNVNKKNDSIWFGIREEQDNIFKARLSYKSKFIPISCILRVQTNSKKGDEYFTEIYGFFGYRNEMNSFIINNTDAEELKNSYSFDASTKEPIKHEDTDIYCDLKGERIINF